MSCYVYSISNGVDEYIGVSTNPKCRFLTHKSSKYPVGRAIRKYNLTYDDNVTILFEGNINECYELEKKLRPFPEMGWNLAPGGIGGSAVSNKGMKGRKHSEITKQLFSLQRSGENAWNYGTTRSGETKQKISKSLMGHTVSEDSKRKMSNSLKGKPGPNKGKVFSDAHRAALSKSHKGNTLSEEVKKRLSDNMKGRPKTVVVCPWCNKHGGDNVMKRWHFDNCKHKEDL